MFTALTLLLPDADEEVPTTAVNASGTVNVTDSQFSHWLNSTNLNISTMVAQIQSMEWAWATPLVWTSSFRI
jgi:hypothetical protein